RLARLLAIIAEVVDISRIKEFSMEANPESLTKEILEGATQAGINRISIGVQSFHDKTLQLLNRIHSAQQVRDAILLAQSYLENISVDIMCGIPGQSPEEFLDDIQQAVDLGITHISIYPLTIEEGTPFEALLEQGKMENTDPDLQAMMMAMAPNVLEPAGFSRYEVASYAKPNFECVHNSAYWTGVSYKGIGQSAVSMRQHEASRERIQDGTVVEVLNRRQMVAEDMMMKMRMARGVTENELRESAVLLPAMLDVFRDLEEKGLIVREDDRYKPTLGGWLLGNELYGRIYELAP
ncbi:MAG: coproporphyrinogen III oxidase family protein, partial [Eggerthellaceae bacterium]|nr:coproporphyrinogen III oxidase family protein [Eggerthellaceae bacterium]